MPSSEFEQASKRVNNLASKPSNEKLLLLYALYKQTTEGDVAGERPGGFDFKAIAKYDAWAKHQGKSAEAAEQEYIELVKELESA
jgi:acyl-CoA-binding protein